MTTPGGETTPCGDETTLLTETLADGTTRREWMISGKVYIDTPEQRGEVEKAITEMNWQRPDVPMAMSPGLMIQEIVRALKLKMVAQIGCAPTEPIEHPACDCKYPDHPDHFGSYLLLGVKCRWRHFWWTLYFLDLGSGAVFLVGDITPAPMPHGGKITVACGKEWHDLCPGTYKKGDDQFPCECTDATCNHGAVNDINEATPQGGPETK